MRTAIISTGDELLRGAIADTNGAWLASFLYEHGLDVSRIFIAPDDLGELVSVFQQAFSEFDFVLVGGGLGPTDDDLTAQAAALAAGVPVLRHPQAEAFVTRAFERIRRPMHPVNLKQADLPQGCTVLDNPTGTAPGFILDHGRARIIFMPGVPSEMKVMFERHVLGLLPRPVSKRYTATFSCFGIGESNIQAAIAPIIKDHSDVRFGFRTSFPENRVTLSCSREERLEQTAGLVGATLGKAVFSNTTANLPHVLGQILSDQGFTLATAESCTGGLIAHELTQVPGSSIYFLGGVVAYDNDVKVQVLGVDKKLIEAHGAVSEEVVSAMAAGARKAMNARIALATSGVAGPGGGTPEKPVGLVHLAVSTAEKTVHRKCQFNGMSRSRVKVAAAWTAMAMALEIVMEER